MQEDFAGNSCSLQLSWKCWSTTVMWPVWLNSLVFIYEVSDCGFGPRCIHVNFRFRACFEPGVPWYSGNYGMWIHSETCTWHDKNIQLPDGCQISENQNHIFQKCKSYEISSTHIYVGEDQEFIICEFSWVSSHFTMESILNAKKKKKKHLTWLKLYLIIISALETKINKHKSSQLSFSTKNFSFFSKFFCSTSSTLFLPFHFTCAFDR